MLHNTDRFAQPAARKLAVGQDGYMPLRLGDRDIYRRRWRIVAFGAGQRAFDSPGMAHTLTLQRLHDRITRTVAQHWWLAYNAD